MACEVVWAEVAAAFPEEAQAESALGVLTVGFAAMSAGAAAAAGDAWRAYRTRGGKRTRVIADFLIGAHAQSQADRLLTSDRGFYRRDFVGLALLKPAGPGRLEAP